MPGLCENKLSELNLFLQIHKLVVCSNFVTSTLEVNSYVLTSTIKTINLPTRNCGFYNTLTN